jgi:sugar lactone lactonase YvrE
LVVAVQTGLFAFDPEAPDGTGAWTFLQAVEPSPTQRLNEGKPDARGRFWIGSISTLGRFPTGGLYRVDPGGVSKVLDEIAVPNCLVFAGDHAFFADSARRIVWRFAFDPDAGAVTDRRVHLDLSADPGIPDGGCLDAEEHLWVAQFGGGLVRRFDPAGREACRIELPVTQVTSLAFCGPGLDRLAITTAKRLLGPEDRARQPQAGDLFLADPGVRGRPEPLVRA